MNYGDSDAVASSRGLTGKRTVTVVPRNAGPRLKVLRVFRIENTFTGRLLQPSDAQVPG